MLDGTKTTIRRFIYNIKHRWLVFDNIVPIICIALCLLWTSGSITAMTRNWQLSETLAKKQQELAILTLEVETLELENNYFASAEYQELSARAKLNKKLPGEELIYLPENTEYSKTKHKTGASLVTIPEKSNLSKWLSFLLDI